MINVNEIAQALLTEIEKMAEQAKADVNYCKGAAEGVRRLVDDIAKAMQPKPEAAVDTPVDGNSAGKEP